MRIFRKLFSLVLVLSFLLTISVGAFADTWYLDEGDISISAGESGQTVTQGSTSKEDAAPVITQNNSTSNTITVESSGDAVAEFTIEGLDVYSDSVDAGSPINIVGDSSAKMTVEGDNQIVFVPGYESTQAAVHVSEGQLTIQGDGYLEINADSSGAKIGSNGSGDATQMDEAEDFSGIIHITGDVEIDTDDDGSADGAAIGSGEDGDFTGSVVIDGNARVEAKSNDRGAGIGAGEEGDFRGSVTIGGNAYVWAEGDDDSAGIGSGEDGSFSGGTITIKDNAVVHAEGSDEGPAIGAADDDPMNGTVIIQDNAQVTLDPGSDCEVAIGAEGSNPGSGSIILRDNASLTAVNGDEEANLVLGGEAPNNSLYLSIGENVKLNGYSLEDVLSGEAGDEVVLNGTFTREDGVFAFFRVLNEKGEALPYTQEQKDGVLTVTVDTEKASLVGVRHTLLLLENLGVESICFVTGSAQTELELDDLAAVGEPSSEVILKHDGAAVTFTVDGEEMADLIG